MTDKEEIAAINKALLDNTLHLSEGGLPVAVEPDDDAHVVAWRARRRGGVAVPGLAGGVRRMYSRVMTMVPVPFEPPGPMRELFDGMPDLPFHNRWWPSEDEDAHVQAFDALPPIQIDKYPDMGIDRRTGALVPVYRPLP